MTHVLGSGEFSQASYDEVIQQAASRIKANTVQLDPAPYRTLELGIANGNHFFERTGGSALGSLVAHDFNFGRTATYRQVRETIVTIGSEVHHYLFDRKYSEFALFTGEIAVDREKQEPVIDIISPPKIASYYRDHQLRVDIKAGSDYLAAVAARAPHVELVSSAEAAAQYVKDTDRFLLPGTRRVKPAVVQTLPQIATWNDTSTILSTNANH